MLYCQSSTVLVNDYRKPGLLKAQDKKLSTANNFSDFVALIHCKLFRNQTGKCLKRSAKELKVFFNYDFSVIA